MGLSLWKEKTNHCILQSIFPIISKDKLCFSFLWIDKTSTSSPPTGSSFGKPKEKLVMLPMRQTYTFRWVIWRPLSLLKSMIYSSFVSEIWNRPQPKHYKCGKCSAAKRKLLCHRAFVLQEVNSMVDSKDWIDSMDSTDSISEILIQSNKTVTSSLIRKFRLPTMIKTTTQIYVNNTSIHIETYIHPPLTHILQY